jgi:hypothetical protein
MTGGARTLDSNASGMEMSKGGVVLGQHWMDNRRWAGPRRIRYPDNLLATAFHNNLFDPLAENGGFDLFVVKRGSVRAWGPSNNTMKASAPSSNGGYEALRPDSVNWRGEPNNMIVYDKGEEHSLPYNASDSTWRWYAQALKLNHGSGMGPRRREWAQDVVIQAALHHSYDQYLCNQLVKNYSRQTNTVYAYKMRVRPDMAMVSPLPPLHEMDFGGEHGNPQRVHVTTSKVQSGGNQDSFGLGRAHVMDVYLDRYPLLHTMHYQRPWVTENFLMDVLWQGAHAIITEHPGIQGAVVRTRGFTRGKPGTSELVARKYEMDVSIHPELKQKFEQKPSKSTP